MLIFVNLYIKTEIPCFLETLYIQEDISMANIGEIAKELAAKIAYQLNQKDSNPNDNFIDANIWKQYAVAKYGIKDCSKAEKISIFNAEQSIIKSLNTQSQATGKSVSDIGELWYNDLVKFEGKQQKPTNINISSYKERNDATAVAKINTPEAKTIQKDKTSKLKQVFNRVTRTLGDCKESAKIHIKQELARRGLTITDAEIEYWSEKIGYMAYKYHMPEEILVSIIGRENKFAKNQSNGNGSGAMALTTIAIEDMFPDKHWSETYAMLDENLYNDIFYKKDAKGQPVLQYKDAPSVRRACSKDDTSIKVGTLYFEMCYAKALTAEIHHKSYAGVTETEVQDTITKLKAGKIDFSKINNEKVLTSALMNYNGCDKHKKNYSKDTMDSLKEQGFDFKEQKIIKKS